MKRVFHVSFFGIRENRRSSKLVETFQKDSPGDTNHEEPLCGQTYYTIRELGQIYWPGSQKMKCVFHVSFFGILENRRSSKSAETFQKDSPGDTDHGELLYGQKY